VKETSVKITYWLNKRILMLLLLYTVGQQNQVHHKSRYHV